MKADCCFCQEIRSGQMPETFSRYTATANRLVADCPAAISIPTISPLAEGHLLIIPRLHVSSTIQVPSDHQLAFQAFIRTEITKVERLFGPVMIFEHGVGQGIVGGCGVDHAHLHILPLTKEMYEDVEQHVNSTFQMGPRRTYSALQKEIPANKSYLLMGCDMDALSYVISDIPSQFLRRTISECLGMPDWDWKKLFGWRVFEHTTASLLQQDNI